MINCLLNKITLKMNENWKNRMEVNLDCKLCCLQIKSKKLMKLWKISDYKLEFIEVKKSEKAIVMIEKILEVIIIEVQI